VTAFSPHRGDGPSNPVTFARKLPLILAKGWRSFVDTPSYQVPGEFRMKKKAKAIDVERRETWQGQGVRLEIVAKPLPDGQWCLSVINERGVFSIWYELFPTAEVAFGVARKAIEEEGVEDFVSIEGFEYLDEEPMASKTELN
jgi:hypothetical protein